MTRIVTLLLNLYLLSSGFAAPAGLKEDAIEKRRDSTKETIELEEALKRLSGENKKFFPPPNGQPQPQIDGLDAPIEIESDNAALNFDAKNDDAQDEPISDKNENELQDLERFQNEQEPKDTIMSETGDKHLLQADERHDDTIRDTQEETLGQNMQPAYNNYAGNEYQDYYTDIYRGSFPQDNPQYGYTRYDAEDAYPLPDTYGEMETEPLYEAQGADQEEYLLQNMMSAVQKHPKLLQMLQKGQNVIEEEDGEGFDQTEEDLDQLGNQPALFDRQLEDLQDSDVTYQGLPTEEDDEELPLPQEKEDNAPPLQSAMQQQGGYDLSDYGTNLQDKEIIKQLETLQELYGDRGAHTVAKKMGYGTGNMDGDTDSTDGSGEPPQEQSNHIFNEAGFQNEEDKMESSREKGRLDLNKISFM